jgi:hypothetical protein
MILSDRLNIEVDPRLKFFKCYGIPKMTRLKIGQLVAPYIHRELVLQFVRRLEII